MSSSTGSRWQTNLNRAMTVIESKLKDVEELAEKDHELQADYDKAIASL
jgi:hypothetical protein